MPIAISRTGQAIEPMPQISQAQRDLLWGAALRAYLHRHPETIKIDDYKEDETK